MWGLLLARGTEEPQGRTTVGSRKVPAPRSPGSGSSYGFAVSSQAGEPRDTNFTREEGKSEAQLDPGILVGSWGAGVNLSVTPSSDSMVVF